MQSFNLNNDQKKILIQVAKETLLNIVYGRKPPEFDIDDEILNKECGAFVTLHMNGGLRGCIGNISAQIPLWKTIRKMTVEAALHDPRFPSVTPAELDEIDIEISVLSPLKKVDNLSEIEVGKHGILIKRGFNQGLLLPQVATEYNWNTTEFLENTCQKAGLDKNCYKKDDCEILIFSAIVFSEKDL